jgi:hypothetical protein
MAGDLKGLTQNSDRLLPANFTQNAPFKPKREKFALVAFSEIHYFAPRV